MRDDSLFLQVGESSFKVAMVMGSITWYISNQGAVRDSSLVYLHKRHPLLELPARRVSQLKIII